MAQSLRTRHEIVVERSIRELADVHDVIQLKHAVRRVEVGIVVTPASWYVEDGVPALRGVNVRPGEIALDDIVMISQEGHDLNRKSALRAGDLVVVRTGKAGATAIVPPDLDGCNCIDLVIIRPSSELLPTFLEFVLNSDWTQKHIDEYSVGTIQSHFNVGAMKKVPIPVPPLDEQQKVIELLTTSMLKTSALTDALSKQIDLLVEHRQAPITAAVTGELDIPGLPT